MPLKPGTTLGPYSVTAKIGEGGMGEVYRARDTKLDRDVALKVLPQAFTEDPDRLARFEREAKVLASLNHPNIGHIYGLEEAEGQKALVLELIEGPTLADRIKQGPISVDEALPIAKQIAEALEAAHEQGIIHRDLKPANIKLRPDGTVKVLDFGLAKVAQAVPEGDPSQSPTLTASATAMGVVLGTAAYMSPEQARGMPVDKRSDIWSFGAVLYEMLSGRRPFGGRDVSEVLGAVVRLDPDWDALPSVTPPLVGFFLRRCLAKEPAERIHDIADMRLALEGAFDGTNRVDSLLPSVASSDQRLFGSRLGVRTLLGILAVVAVTVFLLQFANRTERPRPVRLAVPMESGESVYIDVSSTDIAISPDGNRIAYLTEALPSEAGARQLRVRELDRYVAETVAAEGAIHHPFFSPDGQEVGFYDTDVYPPLLRRVSVSGGDVSTISQLPGNLRGASWRADGMIVLGTDVGTPGIWAVPAAGGEPTQLTTTDSGGGEEGHFWPDLLPDGDHALFTIFRRPVETSQIAIIELDTGEYRVLVEGGTHPRYSQTGHLLYTTPSTLWAVGFDLDRLQLVGEPVQVQERVLTKRRSGADFDVSDSGSLLFVPEIPLEQGRLVFVGDGGHEEALRFPSRRYRGPRLTADDRRVAVTFDGDIWILDLQSGAELRLTEGFRNNGALVWTADEQGIVFGSFDGPGTYNLYFVRSDGRDEPSAVLRSDYPDYPTDISPDGETVLFHRVRSGEYPGHREIWEAPVDGSENEKAILDGEVFRGNPVLSPDGRWLSYESEHSGTMEVYVQSYPEAGPVLRVSEAGGHRPVWGSAGSFLFYRNADEVLTASFDLTGGQAPGQPHRVFSGDYVGNGPLGWAGGERNYDIASDGRFLMVKPEQPRAQLNIILNWDQELLERVPVP